MAKILLESLRKISYQTAASPGGVTQPSVQNALDRPMIYDADRMHVVD